jgi:hypothetical protein
LIFNDIIFINVNYTLLIINTTSRSSIKLKVKIVTEHDFEMMLIAKIAIEHASKSVTRISYHNTVFPQYPYWLYSPTSFLRPSKAEHVIVAAKRFVLRKRTIQSSVWLLAIVMESFPDNMFKHVTDASFQTLIQQSIKNTIAQQMVRNFYIWNNVRKCYINQE